jgi:hypothetical protein
MNAPAPPVNPVARSNIPPVWKAIGLGLLILGGLALGALIGLVIAFVTGLIPFTC